MRRNKLIRHRGLESDSWKPLPVDEQVVELYNAYWRKFGIPADLRISPLNKGEYSIVITDATVLDVEKRDGSVVFEGGMPKIVAGGSNGFYIDDPEIESTLPVVYAVLEAGIRQGHGIVLPMDEMYDRANDRDDRLTNRILTPGQLTEEQKRKMREHGLDNLVGQPLKLSDFEKIFGDVKDKEFYSFPEHSTEGRVKLLAKFAEAVKNQQMISTSGAGKSPVRMIPFQKDGLYPLVPPDERGQNSNHWDLIFEIWNAGRQGEEGRRERKVYICGACIDYSVALTARWMKDTGYDVTVFAPAVKGLGITPKPVMLRELAEAYNINVTWDWPSEFGPEPRDWDKILKKAKDADVAAFEGDGVGSWSEFVKTVEKYQPPR